jgi:hypothetical protein
MSNSPDMIIHQIYESPTVSSPSGPIQNFNIPHTSYTPISPSTPPLVPPNPMDLAVTVDSTTFDSLLFTIDLAIVDDRQAAELIFQVLIENISGDFTFHFYCKFFNRVT